MNLNRTLERLFRSVRAEAARNPAFAAELERALSEFRPRRAPARRVAPPPEPPKPPPINPIAALRRDGAAGLRAALAPLSAPQLLALLAEHNLDPSGAGVSEAAPELVERLVKAAERRVARDQSLFAY